MMYLRTAKARVGTTLKKSKKTRDNDHVLFLAYLNKYHGLRKLIGKRAYKKFRKLMVSPDMTRLETIRRMRQKLQEEGRYVGTKRKQRMARSKMYRDYFRGVAV